MAVTASAAAFAALYPVSVETVWGDITLVQLERLMDAGRLAMDLETDRLDFQRKDWHLTGKVRLCSVYAPELRHVVVVGIDPERLPYRLVALLERSPQVIMHHAPFDMRMWAAHVGGRIPRALCTKVLAKELYPGEDNSLRGVVKRELGLELDKDDAVRLSGFLWPLDARQLHYAVQDVLYLPEVFDRMVRRLNLDQLRRVCRAWTEMRQAVKKEFFGHLEPVRKVIWRELD